MQSYLFLLLPTPQPPPMLIKSLLTSFFTSLVLAVWDPASGGDWAKLKPWAQKPDGAVSSLPFPVGIVTVPFQRNEKGQWEEPLLEEPPLWVPDVKEEFEAKWADIHQMKEGQALRAEYWMNEDSQEDDDDDNDDDDEPWELKGPDCEEKNWFDELWRLEHDYDVSDDADCEHSDSDYDSDYDKNANGNVDGFQVHVVPDVALKKRGHGVKKRALQAFKYPVKYSSCSDDGTLVMHLNGGILTDHLDRIGSIVSNHQFQFDGPVPQYGAIYAAGWLVSKDSLLCLGDRTTFYQCLAGDFHKTYDSPIHDECFPVHLEVVRIEGPCDDNF